MKPLAHYVPPASYLRIGTDKEMIWRITESIQMALKDFQQDAAKIAADSAERHESDRCDRRCHQAAASAIVAIKIQHD